MNSVANPKPMFQIVLKNLEVVGFLNNNIAHFDENPTDYTILVSCIHSNFKLFTISFIKNFGMNFFYVSNLS